MQRFENTFSSSGLLNHLPFVCARNRVDVVWYPTAEFLLSACSIPALRGEIDVLSSSVERLEQDKVDVESYGAYQYHKIRRCNEFLLTVFVL